MNPEGNQGISQSGFNLQDVVTTSPRNSKRSRDENEEERLPTGLGMNSQCVNNAMDLNLSSDIVPSDGGREDQGPSLNNLTVFQAEKRIKCGHSNLDNISEIPVSLGLSANKDAVTIDGGDNVVVGVTSQNVSQECASATAAKLSDKVAEVHPGATHFRCDLCSVKSTSAKDLETHLAGKRHARAQELALGAGVSSIVKSPKGSSKPEIDTSQKVQASTELEHVDVSGEASKGVISSGITTEEANFGVSSSKCPDLNGAKAVAMGHQHVPIMDCSSKEFLLNDSAKKTGSDDSHDRNLCQNVANGAAHNLALVTDGFLESICGRVASEGEPYKCLVASLSAKSDSDCVARALASVLSTQGCPGLGYVQDGSTCGQATECPGSQLEGAKSTVNDGMVTMHTRCFSNLLQDVRINVMEDLLQHGGLKSNSWLPLVAASAPSGEDLNCSVCRVEYGSKADLDLHLAGRKHASLVQRVFSRCQLCNLNCNTERDFKTHLSGKKHASKLRLVQKRVTF